MMRQACIAAALGLAVAQPAAALEYTRFEALWIAPARAGALRPLPALLNLPPGWQVGDAAAVVLFDPPGPGSLHTQLIAALLGRGAAVLELDANTSYGFSADAEDNPPPPTVESLLTDLGAALAELRRAFAPGLVVAFGHGLGGEAVLRAAASPMAGAGGGFVAHVTLGPGEPVFLAGAAPPAAEGWPGRAPMLCEALAFALAAAPTPLDLAATRARDAATARACSAALVPATPPARPAGRW